VKTIPKTTTVMAKRNDVHAAIPILPAAVLDVITFIIPTPTSRLWFPEILGQYSATASPPPCSYRDIQPAFEFLLWSVLYRWQLFQLGVVKMVICMEHKCHSSLKPSDFLLSVVYNSAIKYK
jgi:hypothetical protein